MSELVNTSYGTLQGVLASTESGFNYYSFQGIPYATPPLGNLRFKDPIPLDPWIGVYDATKEGSPCAQSDLLVQQKEFLGEENCLFVNVYTPNLINKNLNVLLPVMVWFHGGGFFAGSGSADIFGPDYLVEKDVIVVTVNYRLGVLGFLSLETEDIPGNAGLKDQVAALKWVRDNIDNFGGDCKNVTIFGESAGGAAVEFLMISPMAKGLFHKAISQSGTCLNQWAHTAENSQPLEKVERLLKLAGKENLNKQETAAFLRTVPVEELVKYAHSIPTFEENKRDSAFAFAPVVEKIYPNIESFLNNGVVDLLQAGYVSDVPYIQGYNSKEGILWALSAQSGEEHLKTLNNNFQYFVPLDMNFPMNSSESIEIANKIKTFYFGSEDLDQNTIDKYFDLMTDFAFVHKIRRSNKLHVKSSKNPVYFYRFSFDGDLNFLKKRLGLVHKGVCHEDDLGYLFKPRMLKLTTARSSPSDVVRSRMVEMWTNFAKNGNPTPQTTELLPVKWEPTSNDSLKYLEIDENIKMAANPDRERFGFWENLYTDYNL